MKLLITTITVALIIIALIVWFQGKIKRERKGMKKLIDALNGNDDYLKHSD